MSQRALLKGLHWGHFAAAAGCVLGIAAMLNAGERLGLPLEVTIGIIVAIALPVAPAIYFRRKLHKSRTQEHDDAP